MRASLLAVFLCLSSPAWAQKGVPPSTVVVGGAPMVSDRELMDNLPGSGEHTMFVHLIQVAGLGEVLRGRGPFTVFAPTDAAFAALPAGTVDQLMRPENKAKLLALLSSMVVPGNYSVARLQYLLRQFKGQTELDTVSNGKLGIATNGPGNIILKDPKGGTARILVYDVKQANGVMYVIDRVLMPG